jgi:hypothetical protein
MVGNEMEELKGASQAQLFAGLWYHLTLKL